MIVAGKGGVGRSAVAAALGLAASRQGRRTLVAELAGHADVARLLEAPAGAGLAEVKIRPHLFHISVERQAALRDYLDHEVPGPIPAGRLTRSRTFSMFIQATPGMGELLSIGKVWELTGAQRRRAGARSYDQVVLDGPASGQLMALLRAPRTFGAIARLGPVAQQTKGIRQMLTDPGQTGVVLVCTPEQMAVSEALVLRDELQEDGMAVDGVVVNRAVKSPFSRQQEKFLLGLEVDDPALRSARWLCRRAGAQREQVSRLTRELAGIPQRQLPLVFGGLDAAGMPGLADRLAGASHE